MPYIQITCEQSDWLIILLYENTYLLYTAYMYTTNAAHDLQPGMIATLSQSLGYLLMLLKSKMWGKWLFQNELSSSLLL